MYIWYKSTLDHLWVNPPVCFCNPVGFSFVLVETIHKLSKVMYQIICYKMSKGVQKKIMLVNLPKGIKLILILDSRPIILTIWHVKDMVLLSFFMVPLHTILP